VSRVFVSRTSAKNLRHDVLLANLIQVATIGANWAQARWSFQRLTCLVRNHWLALSNIVVGLVLAGAVAAPILEYAGYSAAAQSLHHLYLALCPQRPGHSFFLFSYQLALEEREIAMFTAQLVGGLLYAYHRARRRVRLHSAVFLITALPFAWDIVTQTVDLRSSDWYTRSWTGALFMLAFVFWCYPRLEEDGAGSRQHR
jgi:uncharacterized membrane protein